MREAHSNALHVYCLYSRRDRCVDRKKHRHCIYVFYVLTDYQLGNLENISHYSLEKVIRKERLMVANAEKEEMTFKKI